MSCSFQNPWAIAFLAWVSVIAQASRLWGGAEEIARSPSGNAVIRAPFAGSEIVITTTDRLAGAIHSLTWNGKELIDSTDHGRQLQSASSFDSVPPENAEP